MADSGWNLPPGCFEHHIPGNRPQDVAYERAVEDVTDDWAEKCSEYEQECEFALVARLDDDAQFVMCSKMITKCLDGDAIVMFGKGGTDPSECPYFESEVEKRTEAIMDGDDAPEWDDD